MLHIYSKYVQGIGSGQIKDAAFVNVREAIEHAIVECKDYQRYRGEFIFKVGGIGREEWLKG